MATNRTKARLLEAVDMLDAVALDLERHGGAVVAIDVPISDDAINEAAERVARLVREGMPLTVALSLVRVMLDGGES